MDSGHIPSLTSSYTANLQGHACYPTINKDGQKTEVKWSSAQPISSSTGINNDNTTRLSPLIKGYKRQRRQHPQQAVALVECCTSVTQRKRRAGIISVATLVRGTTPSPNSTLLAAVTQVVLHFSACDEATGDLWPPDSSDNVMSKWSGLIRTHEDNLDDSLHF